MVGGVHMMTTKRKLHEVVVLTNLFLVGTLCINLWWPKHMPFDRPMLLVEHHLDQSTCASINHTQLLEILYQTVHFQRQQRIRAIVFIDII